jgi:hypothetical protein
MGRAFYQTETTIGMLNGSTESELLAGRYYVRAVDGALVRLRRIRALRKPYRFSLTLGSDIEQGWRVAYGDERVWQGESATGQGPAR